MSARKEKRANLTSQRNANVVVGLGLHILDLISSNPEKRVSEAAIRSELDLDEDQLHVVVDTLCALSDCFATGGYVSVEREGGDLVLVGEIGDIDPLRLSPESSALLSQILREGDFAEEDAARIASALATTSDGASSIADRRSVRSVEYYGPFSQTLSEAAQDGVRCLLSYRSTRDASPHDRLIDPGFFKFEEGRFYLVAWDVETDAQRTYRTDRIADVELTQESVTRHPFRHETMREGLERDGAKAVIRIEDATFADTLGWAGLHVLDEDDAGDGIRAEVSYSSEPWLFGQVLAAGGKISIVAPEDLRERFLAYAHELLAPADDEEGARHGA